MTAAAMAAVLAGTARAQTVAANDLPLENGADVMFLYSDPSVGFATGTFPPDFGGDLFWKVLPRDVLLASGGTLEISTLEFAIYDTDPVTPAPIYDLMLTRGKPSAAFPGSIEPDFADPNAVFLSPGTGIPSICSFMPEICPPLCTPVIIDQPILTLQLQLGTCSGDGIAIRADGSQDLVVTAFLPGGMHFDGGPPPSCPMFHGDYVLMDAHSTDETQADWLGTGASAYGGFQIGGGGMLAEGRMDTWALRVQFCEPILSVALSSDPFMPYYAPPWSSVHSQGLAGVRASVGGGTASLQYVLYDLAGVGDLALVASSLAPTLPPPGFSFLGASLLLDPADPVLHASIQTGAVLDLDSWPLGDGVFASGTRLPLPASAVGLSPASQALVLDVAAMSARSSQVTRTHLHP
jgi:hypothetical protein